jgi:N-acyl-D-amino-acid deacylase
MKRTLVALLCLGALMGTFTATAQRGSSTSPHDYDLIIRGGRIADGTGNPSYFGDIAVSKGRIVAIGDIQGSARTELQAQGHVVAPGFIDVHTHAEEIEELPLAENFLRMGVTTLVLGNCGGSKLELGKFYTKLEKMGFSANVCSLIGHGKVRGEAMGGSFMRLPNTEELEKMKAIVEKAMKDGAVGMSTGLIYLPGTYAKTEEIIELAKVVSKYDGVYATHQRSESDEILQSLEEVFRIAREANVRAEVSHIKLSGKANWGQTDKVLAAIEKARAEGLDITQDQYSYTASSTGISQLVPDSFREGGRTNFVKRLDDPEQKKKIIAQMKETLRKRGNTDYSYAVIASYKADRSLNGMNVAEAAKKKRGSDSLDDQIEMVLEIERNDGASAVFHGMSEEDVIAFMKHPNTMVASDSSVRKLGADVPHPRGYGNNARVLGRYVREKKVIRIEDAIRKMSSLPANTFRIQDRGLIRVGNWADIVVFDPEKVIDNSEYKDPHHYSTGFKYVTVNGKVVIENDVHNQSRPGRILRHKSAPHYATSEVTKN